MIQVTELYPGITLRCIPDDRFKHGCLSLQLLRPMCRQEAAMNALLPAVLLQSQSSGNRAAHILNAYSTSNILMNT